MHELAIMLQVFSLDCKQYLEKNWQDMNESVKGDIQEVQAVVHYLQHLQDTWELEQISLQFKGISRLCKEVGGFVLSRSQSKAVAIPQIHHIDIIDLEKFRAFYGQLLFGNEQLKSDIKIWYHRSLFGFDKVHTMQNNFDANLFVEVCGQEPYMSKAVEYALYLMRDYRLKTAIDFAWTFVEIDNTDMVTLLRNYWSSRRRIQVLLERKWPKSLEEVIERIRKKNETLHALYQHVL